MEKTPEVAGGQDTPEVAGGQDTPEVAGGQDTPEVAGGQEAGAPLTLIKNVRADMAGWKAFAYEKLFGDNPNQGGHSSVYPRLPQTDSF